MTTEIMAVYGIIAVLILLFISEKLSIDVIAFSLMVVLMVTGLVTPQQGIMGFANQATVTILALMLIGVGLEQSGAVTQLGKRLEPLLLRPQWQSISILMIITATVSAFISTTAVVIVFLRILVQLSRRLELPLSKFLMPLSFAAILGGSCSLMGTSTNLIVNGIAKDFGVEPFGLFEFTNVGVIFFVAALLYMIFVGRHLLTDRRKKNELTESYRIKKYLIVLRIPENSSLIGQRVEESLFSKESDLDLLEVRHNVKRPRFAAENEEFSEGDLLLVKSELEHLQNIFSNKDLSLINHEGKGDEQLSDTDFILCEAMVGPNSKLIGKLLSKINIKQNYSAMPLAVRQGKNLVNEQLRKVRIEVGDILLMQVRKGDFKRFYQSPDFVVLEEHTEYNQKTDKRYLAICILIGVILVSAFGFLPIMVSSLAGAALMMLTRCIDLKTAYREIDWSIIFLLAGMIPLGSAMHNTGADQYLANLFVDVVGDAEPRLFIAAIFGITCLMSGFISNNATAILLAPIAISIALQLNLSPQPFLLAVMFAANMSFFTPIGYQTNTLIFSPGNYKFRDFMIVGGILTLIVWGLATVLIPVFYF